MKIMRIFVNLPNKNWYELQSEDYIFDMPVKNWRTTNPKIEEISKNKFIPIAIEGVEFLVHISNFIFG